VLLEIPILKPNECPATTAADNGVPVLAFVSVFHLDKGGI